MTIFELWGSIGLKTQAFTEGLSAAVNDIKKFESNIGSVISAAKKVDNAITSISDAAVKGAASIVTSTIDIAKAVDQNVMGVVDQAAGMVVEGFQQMIAAGTDFAKQVMEEGMAFDTAMGQVSATLLKTREDFDEETVSVNGFTGSLRDLAKELGATTRFTATQAGEALNYMALAGYDAQTSAEMLPKVLDLAAAGAMDLGTASDMVTDAQTALGLSLDDTTVLIDQMAKTASSSNTSVSQLGDAILTIGATARDLKGGFTELNTALGVLADNGIKASEGGNTLRRLITRLAAPTGEAAAKMKELGFSAYDAQDNMKSLPDIFMELNQAMAGLTDKQRKSAITDIFGQYALAGANALLNTSAERWETLTGKIQDSAGAAQEMADIQLDTLPGQVIILGSAFSGLKTELYERVSPAAKDFIETLSGGLSEVTKEITSGNFEAAFSRLGSTAAELIDKGVNTVMSSGDTINQFIDGIIRFAEKTGEALFEGGSELMPRVLGHLLYFSQRAIASFSEFLSNSENLLTIERTITHMFDQISTFLDENRDNLYIIFSTLFDVAIQFVDDIFVLKRETVYSILYEKTTELLGELTDNIGTYLSNEQLTETVDNIITFIGNVAQQLLDSSAVILPPLLKFALDVAGKVVSGIANFIGNKENESKIRATIEQIISSIEDFLDENEDDLFTIVNTAVDILIGFLPRIFLLRRKTVWDLIWREWKTLFEPWGENIGKWLAGRYLAIQKWFDESKELIDLALKDIGTKAGKWLADKYLAIRDWFEESKELITLAWENIDLQQIGENIVTGLWQGISDARDWLIEKIGGFTDDVVNSFKDFFGIQSPSKVMENSVGKFLAQGVGVGFEAEMDKVAKNMQAAVPIDFNIQTSSIKVPKAAAKNINLSVNIEKFVNNSDDDINHIASKLSSMLRNEIYSDMAAMN